MKEFDVEKIYGIVSDKIESWITETIELLPNLGVAILVIVLFYLLAKIIKNLSIKGLKRVSTNLSLNHLVGTVLHIATLTAGIFIALDVLELDKTVTSLLAGIGIAGLALSFAFQDTAANFVSGILLAIRTPIKSGDIVEIQDVMGTIDKINLRATQIITFQGTFVIIPNKSVLQNPIFNYSHTGRRRIDLEGRVAYHEDLELVKKITLEAVSDLESVSNKRETLFHYDEFGESGVKFYVRAWVTDLLQPKYLETQHQLILAIKKAYDQHDITIPLGVRTLNFGAKGSAKLDEVFGKED